MSKEKVGTFLDYQVSHLEPSMIDALKGESIHDEEEVDELTLAKLDVHRSLVRKLIDNSNTVLRQILKIVDSDAGPVAQVELGVVAGFTMGFALGNANPSSEDSKKKFEEAVMKLMDRREHGCEDPNCLHCEISRKLGLKKPRPKVHHA